MSYIYFAEMNVNIPVRISLESEKELTPKELEELISESNVEDFEIGRPLNADASYYDKPRLTIYAEEEDIIREIDTSWFNNPDDVRISKEEI
jgi:hypothetical protein